MHMTLFRLYIRTIKLKGDKNMGKIISFVMTLIIIGFVNWVATLLFPISFLDSSLVVGIICMVILYIPNSSGGPMSNALNKSIEGETGIK